MSKSQKPDTTPRMMTRTELVAETPEQARELGRTQAQQILGQDTDDRGRKLVIQHGKNAHRAGIAAEVVDATEHDPHTKLRFPCHVLRYDDGQLAYLRMDVPGYPIDEVPFTVRHLSNHYCEWLFENAPDENGQLIPVVYRALLVKGRPVE